MRRFPRVFSLKGGNTAFRPLKALSLLFAFLLIFSSISVGRSAYAENAPLDKFPFVGAYAVYIARGVYQGFLKDFSKGLGLCIDSKGPTPELKKSHYISVEWGSPYGSIHEHSMTFNPSLCFSRTMIP